ncbi:MAG: hypothetical protein WCV93_02020 [Candidatus Shapirobacteria bacterium]|jgi:hypothetical protein
MERSPIGFKPELHKPVEKGPSLEKIIEASPIELQARVYEALTTRLSQLNKI